MSVLFGYFLRVFVSLCLLVALIDTVEINRRAGSVAGFGFADLFTLAALRMPSFVQSSVSFIVLIASLLCLLALNKRHELVITRASGLSAWQFIAPICVGSMLIGVITIGALNPLASATFRMAETREISFGMTRSREDGRLPWVREATETGAMIIGAAASAEDGTLLSQARFFILDGEGALQRRIDADEARLSGGAWRLTNAVVRDADGPATTLAQMEVASNLDPRFLKGALANPRTVPFYQLLESSRMAKAFGLASGPYDMEFHGLIALPALLVAMSLIAATVSLRFARFGQSSTAIMGGVLAGFLLYVVIEIAKTLGEAGVAAPVVCAWLPVAASAMFGVTFLLHREDG
jgi:lipopolysaccharide export system permease protein